MNSSSSHGASICFVSMDNLNRVPYVRTYVEWIDEPFDVLYWDRSGVCDTIGESHAYVYSRRIDAGGDGANKVQKILGYLGFRNFALKVLKQNDYKIVFALTGNCAVLISDILLGKYERRYVIDIRDYWHEDFAPYHNREQECIQHSALAVISSPAYKKFLCEHDYLVMHNDQRLDSTVVDSWREKRMASRPFVISCVGAMKNPDFDKRVIDYFANDGRFEIRFIGRGYDQLAEYCEQKSIFNVITKGSFEMSETMAQYDGADAVLNMYGSHSPYWDYALSNKLYFAARLGIPIVVCKDTAMAEYSQRYNFGYAIDLDNQSYKDAILASYSSKNRLALLRGCDEFLRSVEMDDAKTERAIRRLVAVEAPAFRSRS